LQMRNMSRAEPEVPAEQHIDGLTVAILAQKLEWPRGRVITMETFWRGVAQLGGHQGRRGDGPPGWKTIWRGWESLQDLVSGARLMAELVKHQNSGPT